jgi:hypothetical protein
MPKTAIFRMRVEESELDEWRTEADHDGLSVSQWIRERCNGAMADVSGTETPAVHEGGVSKRRSRQGGNGVGPKGIPLSPPKERDTAAHVPAESPSTNLIDASVARKTGHEVGCDCALGCAPLRRMFKGAK